MTEYFARLSEVNRLELLGCRMTAAVRLEQLGRDFPQHFAGAQRSFKPLGTLPANQPTAEASGRLRRVGQSSTATT